MTTPKHTGRRAPRILAALAALIALAIIGCADAPTPIPTPTSIPTAISEPSPSPTARLPIPAAIPFPTPTSAPIPTPTAPPPTPMPIRAPLPSLPAPLQPPERDLAELAVRLRGVTLDDAPPKLARPMAQGAQQDFWITRLRDGSAYPITATLQVVSDNAYWFVDDAVSVDSAGLERAAQLYEDRVRPAVVGAFGDIVSPGIDGDPRLVVLHTALDGAAGYFGSKDGFPTAVHPHSNRRQIIYIDARALPPGSDYYMSVIAHELQHAIHANADDGEDAWVNEGLSEVATEVAGYATRSPQLFMRRTHTQLNHWPDEPRDTPPHYGASALFFTYLAQRVGGPERLANLAAEPLDGIAGVDAFLRRHGLTFESVFADWLIANYLDAPDPRYGYAGRNVRARPVLNLPLGANRRESLPQYSARYYRLDPRAKSGVITFDGESETRQIAADCARGPTCWWSGRGDSIDTTLTREFDLSGVDAATLQFDVWHEIEEGWDYAYVQASGDDGRTWRILEGEHTTADNPSGNAYGPGYTGQSDGWQRETIDLTPFAGAPVLLRFEYVTDDAVYLDGLLIDNIAIPELGFADNPADAAQTAEWTANGFQQAGKPIEQRFIVTLLRKTPDGGFSATRVPLDAGNYARLEWSDPDAAETVIIVSPTANHTRHAAEYTLSFR